MGVIFEAEEKSKREREIPQGEGAKDVGIHLLIGDA
jgi:hypothetical protein